MSLKRYIICSFCVQSGKFYTCARNNYEVCPTPPHLPPHPPTHPSTPPLSYQRVGGELVVVDVVMVVCLLCNQSTTQPHYTFHMQLLGHYDVQCPLQSNHNMFPSLVPSPPPVLSVIPHIACPQ